MLEVNWKQFWLEMDWKQFCRDRPSMAGLPLGEPDFWRFGRSADPTEADFLPDCDVRERFPRDDYCSYRGFSAWQTQDMAVSTIEALNPVLEKKGLEPYTHVIRFQLWPERGHVCAWLGPEEEHWGVWAPSEELRSRVLGTFPI